MDLRDQVVWITGASSGIGEGLVYELAKRDSRLILSARRVKELERVRDRCIELGKGNAAARRSGTENAPYILPFDVTELDTLPARAAEAHAQWGRLDILINNAGIGMRGYVVDTDIAVQQRGMQVNYFGQIALTKAVLSLHNFFDRLALT